MNRREFLRVSAVTTAVGTIASGSPGSTAQAAPAATTRTTMPAVTPAVLNAYSVEAHRRRLESIGVCERGVRKCMRKHLITSYLPGQCCYNLCGEYPS